MFIRYNVAVCFVLLGLQACSSADPAPAASSNCPGNARSCTASESPLEPGKPVTLALSTADQAALAALDADLAPLSAATSESLRRDHGVSFQNDLGYDPMAAQGLATIQATPLALDSAELGKLSEQGFAISKRQTFANMAYGLKTIYANDLPVYISLDAILDAVHNSYRAMLKSIEGQFLTVDLRTLLVDARSRLPQLTVDAQTRADLDLYLTVALSLLSARAEQPVAGADAAAVAKIVQQATAAQGIQQISLFDVKREVDFSQFTPRGHYADSPLMSQYFRATMWLGRTDFRLIETLPNGSSVFHRRQLQAALALRDVVQGDGAQAFARIDSVVTAFVGGHDYMQLHELDALLEDLGASSAADVAGLSDQQIAQTVIEKGYGAQRIASQVIFKDPAVAARTLPLDRSFALLGQRYIVDSHVFSEVVYDRVLPGPGAEPRYLPDPLDAAYAALGNSAALPLLAAGLDRARYAPQLERMRKLIDAHEPTFWDENMYNTWLSALRAVSPPLAADPKLPAVARSESWSRRMLNTQLGSWAQLRHDSLLYAKQSYTAGDSCEFPDAYVDPYPEAFARLAVFAARGKEMSKLLVGDESAVYIDYIRTYFDELASVSNILRDMAQQQREGVPFNAAQMAFVNDAVKSRIVGCGGPATYEGWYARLLFNRSEDEMDPTIADVHTDPGGNRPPQVLHVATGLPRLMVVTIDACNGPRAYAGVSYAYHEVVPVGLQRLTDSDWEKLAPGASDVPWMQAILP